MSSTSSATNGTSRPLSLIAELTHRCPLHCLYCSNPVEMRKAAEELTTEDWERVFREAADLGILQLNLTGGEPLIRKDLAALIASGRRSGLYVNMITSGVGLSEERLAELVEAGLEHLQLSFQDLEEASANHIAGTRAHAIKLALAPVIRKFPLAFTVNLVVHRMNLDRLPQFITMAEELSPDRLEIAHVQYYGWALKNRSMLMPTEEQVQRSLEIVANAKERLRGKIQLESVVPDYFASFPKACVGGWGRQMMLVDPAGNALPCHAAAVISNLEFDNVRTHELGWIWHNSNAFQRFRGDAWMPDTCSKCPRKEVDFGGCRCQAYLLTGNANAIDPVCRYSPSHGLLETIRTTGAELMPVWRN